MRLAMMIPHHTFSLASVPLILWSAHLLVALAMAGGGTSAAPGQNDGTALVDESSRNNTKEAEAAPSAPAAFGENKDPTKHSQIGKKGRDSTVDPSRALVDPSQMALLREYSDRITGNRRDYYTTTTPVASKESSYAFERVVGKVLKSRGASDPRCATARVAMFVARLATNDTERPGGGTLVDLDFKSFGVKIGEALNETRSLSGISAPYEPTGESYYCVLKRGECGATVPLHLFNHVRERGIMANLNTLCYYWPRGFRRPSAASLG